MANDFGGERGGAKGPMKETYHRLSKEQQQLRADRQAAEADREAKRGLEVAALAKAEKIQQDEREATPRATGPLDKVYTPDVPDEVAVKFAKKRAGEMMRKLKGEKPEEADIAPVLPPELQRAKMATVRELPVLPPELKNAKMAPVLTEAPKVEPKVSAWDKVRAIFGAK